jgi:transposase-like protein
MAKEYPPEVKAAVLAAILTGSSIASVAREHGVSKRTVSRWKDETQSGAQMDAPQKEKALGLGELVYGYLTESITTLRLQVAFFRDETWLRQQSAADIAILHGVVTDKAVRLLAAIRRDDNSGGTE